MSTANDEERDARCEETPLVFDSEGTALVAIINRPANASVGVVLVAGGDQYRVGSHRLFVQLARSLAAHGVAAMRFDQQGIGDNAGRYPGFENTFADIEAAVREFREAVPGLRKVVLGGLCDGASAALMAAHQIGNIDGLVLMNPWVHTSDLEARARLDGYYMSRLKGREFWRKLITGRINLWHSGRSLLGYLLHYLRAAMNPDALALSAPGYLHRMLIGLRRLQRPVLIVLSGNDMVAHEFEEFIKVDNRWAAALAHPDVEVLGLSAADHSFTEREQRELLETQLCRWVESPGDGARGVD